MGVGLVAKAVAELGEAAAEDLAVAALAGGDQAQDAGQILVGGDVGPSLQIDAGGALGEGNGVEQAQVGRLLDGGGGGHAGRSSVGKIDATLPSLATASARGLASGAGFRQRGGRVETAAMNRRQLSLALAAAALAGPPLTAAAQVSRTLVAAVDGPQRTAKNRARDPWRHPAETLAFWGLGPGMTVVEIEPSGGYWTEILAPYLKADRRALHRRRGGRAGGVQGAVCRRRPIWGGVEVTTFGPTSGPLAPAGSADMVLTARNIHDWMWTPGLLDKVLADFHAALKPGGILAVEEHRADPRPQIADARDGYVATAFVIGAVRKGRLQAGRAVGDQRQSQGHQGPSVRGLDPAAHPAQRTPRASRRRPASTRPSMTRSARATG